MEIGDEPRRMWDVRIYWIMGDTHPRMWTTGSKLRQLRTCIMVLAGEMIHMYMYHAYNDLESRGETGIERTSR